jgi:hypothetical protein
MPWHAVDLMGKLKRFASKHWKKILGGAVAVAGAFVPPLAPLIPIGTLLFGSDFQLGSSVGTPIGAAGKRVAEGAELTKALSPEQLRELADKINATRD